MKKITLFWGVFLGVCVKCTADEMRHYK